MTPTEDEDKAQLPCYRSGAAARLARMPVTTLRIWERRYGVVSPPKTPSGQRLYSSQDVRRLVLLKKLVERGHAIGSIARLELDQLDRLALTYAEAAFPPDPAEKDSESTLVIVGTALARRLRSDLPQLQSATQPRLTVFDDLQDARAHDLKTDALVIHVASLQDDAVQAVLALGEKWHAKVMAVVYAFGTEHGVSSLRHAGVRVYREPLEKNQALQVLHDLSPQQQPRDALETYARTPRRYSDETLAAIAGRSSTIACECPRHLADLVRQLSAFEQYSDDCQSRSPADAALHRYLAEIANRARAMFELALERVAREERWAPEET
ncbi:MerR family transcriptional regulator [Paraburkholderia sp. DHOC27]|uniref:MerR family transcriptional regulator n=1 Tax=Paraburkholderia sp. DHOC27 TaxID=2303330 RepID=UPI0015F3275F|nr:MerR family transcriptional regulator [Paraburkholderia sp. DHOC27]